MVDLVKGEDGGEFDGDEGGDEGVDLVGVPGLEGGFEGDAVECRGDVRACGAVAGKLAL